MKDFHRNIIEAVVESLKLIFDENKYTDRVVEKVLKSNAKWGSRDRRFIAETIYEIVRWHRLVRYVVDPENENVTNHWHVVAAWFVISGQPFPAWKEFDGVDVAAIKLNFEKAKKIRKIRESIPDWMDEICQSELGDKVWDRELPYLNNQAHVVLRANSLKVKTKTLQQKLFESGVETTLMDGFPDALLLTKRQNVFNVPEFRHGLFEVQDAGSQMIAPFLKVENGMSVIDACAGGGGKSLHLAAIMKNSGRLLSMDVEGWKLDELNKRAERNGVTNIQTRLIDGKNTIAQLHNSADRLLLDVPCSGLGVLRRNPDAKWKLTAAFVESVKQTQQEILQEYTQMLRKGGLMVYATCSVLPSENRGQIDQFLELQKGKFELQEENVILPSAGFDGFYMARLKKLG